jgi:hypothetical protein
MKGDLSIYFNIPNPVNQNNGSLTLKYKEQSINIPFSDIVHMKIDYAAKALNQFKFYCHKMDDVIEQQLINDFKSYLTIEMQNEHNAQDINGNTSKVFTFDCDMDGMYFDILVENLDDVIVLFENIVNKQHFLSHENEANNHSHNPKSSSISIIPKYIDKNPICVFIDKDTYLNPDENVYEYINFSHMKSFNIKHSITTNYHLDFFDYSEHSCELQNENLDLVTFIMDDGSEITVSSMKNIQESMFQVLFNTEQSGTFSCYVMMFYNKLTELLNL